MDLKKARRELERFFSGLNLVVSYEETAEKVRVTSRNVNLKGHDDDIFLDVSFYNSGIAAYVFVFDKLGINPTTLKLINDFNEQVFAFKAYIRTDGYLCIVQESEPLSEDLIYSFCQNVFADLIADRTYKYLSPLTSISS